MNLKKVLSKDVVRLGLEANTKNDIIEEILDILVDAGKVPDRKAALKCLLEREKKMSTGMQYGIAIPHGKTDTVDGLVAALAIKKGGMDFGSLDSLPSTIFILTLSPVNRTGPHIQFMAEISRLLSEPECCKKVLAAGDAQEVLDILFA